MTWNYRVIRMKSAGSTSEYEYEVRVAHYKEGETLPYMHCSILGGIYAENLHGLIHNIADILLCFEKPILEYTEDGVYRELTESENPKQQGRSEHELGLPRNTDKKR